MDVQGDTQLIEILKWVGVALAVGFIGYFGRYLAMRIIDRMHKRKAQQPPTPAPTTETPVSQDTRLEEVRLKVEKKKAKAKAKKAKKAQKD